MESLTMKDTTFHALRLQGKKSNHLNVWHAYTCLHLCEKLIINIRINIQQAFRGKAEKKLHLYGLWLPCYMWMSELAG